MQCPCALRIACWRPIQDFGIAKVIVNHDLSLFEALACAEGEQTGIAGSGSGEKTDAVGFHLRKSVAIKLLEKFLRELFGGSCVVFGGGGLWIRAVGEQNGFH